MSLRSYIAHSEQRSSAELPRNRELVLFGVSQNIFVIERRRSSDRQKVCPVDWSIFVRQWHWKALALDISRATINKWRHKFWRYGAAVEGTEWSIPDFVEVCRTFECAIELSPTYANAGLAGTSG